jgi:hypothetical protein
MTFGGPQESSPRFPQCFVLTLLTLNDFVDREGICTAVKLPQVCIQVRHSCILRRLQLATPPSGDDLRREVPPEIYVSSVGDFLIIYLLIFSMGGFEIYFQMQRTCIN